MPSKTYYLEQIEKELAMAHEALREGNDGKARVCARRASGQALSWYLTKFSHSNWGTDALRQLQHAAREESIPIDVKDAATRLTTKISDQFTYPFTTNPIDDAAIIIDYVKSVMDSDHD